MIKGPSLENIMHEAGIDRNSLAFGTGINYFTLAKYITGERDITRKMAVKLAEFFTTRLGREITPDYFIPEKKVAAAVTKVPVYTYNGQNTFNPSKVIAYASITTEDLVENEYFYLLVKKLYAIQPFKHTRLLCGKTLPTQDGDLAVIDYHGAIIIRILKTAGDNIALCDPTGVEEITLATAADFKVIGKCVRVESTL